MWLYFHSQDMLPAHPGLTSYLYTLRSLYCYKSGLPTLPWAGNILRLTAEHYVYRRYNLFHRLSLPFSLFISFSIHSAIILVFPVKLRCWVSHRVGQDVIHDSIEVLSKILCRPRWRTDVWAATRDFCWSNQNIGSLMFNRLRTHLAVLSDHISKLHYGKLWKSLPFEIKEYSPLLIYCLLCASREMCWIWCDPYTLCCFIGHFFLVEAFLYSYLALETLF